MNRINRIDVIKKTVEVYRKDESLLSPQERGYLKDLSYLLSLNERMKLALDEAEKALEEFTIGKYYRSIVNDTWGPMVHMEDEPWKIAEVAVIAIKSFKALEE